VRTALRPWWHANVEVVVGAASLAHRVANGLDWATPPDVPLLCFAGPSPAGAGRAPRAELSGLSAVAHVDRPVITVEGGPDERWLGVLDELRADGLRVRMAEPIGARARGRVVRAATRVLDVSIALVALLALAPLFALVAWRIKRTSPGPVFFRQRRLGRDMREFTLLKFRTMRVGTSPEPHREYVRSLSAAGARPDKGGLFKLSREDAVTSTGRWLRRTSIDEVPQLLNVLQGSMSVVGPRPCLAHELSSFAARHYERFAVRPGLTGLWQVTARARSTFVEALDYDVAYVRGWSLGLDLRLIAKTPVELLRGNHTV
jgi:lipopolysaccharide/colanic/teichoic acid biosynthesis glycosyltransferase